MGRNTHLWGVLCIKDDVFVFKPFTGKVNLNGKYKCFLKNKSTKSLKNIFVEIFTIILKNGENWL